MNRTTKPTLTNLALRALDYAHAVEETAHCKLVLQGGYLVWRKTTGNEWADIERGSQEWDAMMKATQSEYGYLQKAKRRERHCKAKLLAAAKEVV